MERIWDVRIVSKIGANDWDNETVKGHNVADAEENALAKTTVHKPVVTRVELIAEV